MTLNAFTLLLISHVLGDVIFNSSRLAVFKRTSDPLNQVLGIGFHCGIHAFFVALLLSMGDQIWVRAALLAFGIHFFIDFIRCRLEMRLFGSDRIYMNRSEFLAWLSGKRNDPKKMEGKDLWPWFLINLLDQGAHLVSLYGIALMTT